MTHYLSRGEKVELRRSTELSAVSFASNDELLNKASILTGGVDRGDLTLMAEDKLLLYSTRDSNLERLADAPPDLGRRSDVYEGPGGSFSIPDGMVNVDFGRRSSSDVRRLLGRKGGRIVEEPSVDFPFHLVEPEDRDPFRLANELAEMEDLEAIPRFLDLVPWIDGDPPSLPSDEAIESPDLFSLQWGLRAIKAVDAWALSEGNPEIAVAILDTGVDLSHPDLAANLLEGVDFVDGGDPEPRDYDYHGTACAGIVAAVKGNNAGIVGVAPRCRCLPIRAGYTLTVLGKRLFRFRDDSLTRSIYAAVRKKAAVLSMSLGSKRPDHFLQTAVHNAFEKGREDKGCVIVAAAGNQGPDAIVDIPARFQEVIGVAATLRDGSHWPGSHQGPEISVAAPGVDIVTTDISGPGGASVFANPPAGRDYVLDFGMTSGACAFVAGVAALILSRNSQLTARQVVRIMERTAANYPNRDERLGHGIVNALAAVQAAAP